MRALCWVLLGISLALPSLSSAEARIERLRAEATEVLQAETYEEQAHAAELFAFVEDDADFDKPARAYVRRARRSCRSGHMDGCLRLGAMYDNGDNDFFGLKHQLVQIDWADALFLHACDNGSAEGCAIYANRFRYGYRNDEAKAARYSRKACQMGHRPACKN